VRLAIFSPHFLPSFIGGVEHRAYRLARWLMERGHDPHVMCIESVNSSGSEPLRQEDTYDGIPVRRIFLNLAASPNPLRQGFSNPVLEKEASSLLETFQPDVLLVFSGNLLSGGVIRAAQNKSIPVFFMTTDFWLLCPRVTLLKPDGSLCQAPENSVECSVCLCLDKRRYRMISSLTGGISNRLLTKMWELPFLAKAMGKKETLEVLKERQVYLKQLFQKVNLAVSESRFLRTRLLSRGFEALRFLQIRQGIRLTAKNDTKNTKTGDPLHIGYLGQIASHKGVDVLVRAFMRLSKHHPQSVLKIYGDLSRVPQYVQRLKHLAGEKKAVDFCGSFANEDVYKILKDIDVLVVPSLWFENSPNVILEAFASGTPVVASNFGGMTELVEHEVNGLLFKRGDVKDLYRTLRKLSEKPELLASFREGIQSVKTESEEWEEIVELSMQLIGQDKKGGHVPEKK